MLKKLLFVHGSWSYHRSTKMVLFSLYKNVLMNVVQVVVTSLFILPPLAKLLINVLKYM